MQNSECRIENFVSRSPAQTHEIAARLADRLVAGDVVAFRGGMGAGKTAFTAGLALALGFEGDVYSPTFALVNEYFGGRFPIFHFDMYRVCSWEDLESAGFFEYLNRGGVCVVEWSENIAAALPEQTIFVGIEITGEETRNISIVK